MNVRHGKAFIESSVLSTYRRNYVGEKLYECKVHEKPVNVHCICILIFTCKLSGYRPYESCLDIEGKKGKKVSFTVKVRNVTQYTILELGVDRNPIRIVEKLTLMFSTF